MSDNEHSVKCHHNLVQSIIDTNSMVVPIEFEATQPKDIVKHTREVFDYNPVVWSWPKSPSEDGPHFATGLYKKHYPSVDQNRVIACALSHYRLWKLCAEEDQPIMILEHDAIFTRRFDGADFIDEKWGAVGLNDPRGATRKGSKFHQMVQSRGNGIQAVPKIDSSEDLPLPMGLAGHSAYLLRPYAAKELLDTIRTIGMWPNDAVMCVQLFRWLRVVNPYYTTIQRGVSTTTQL